MNDKEPRIGIVADTGSRSMGMLQEGLGLPPTAILDPISAPPVVKGKLGRAWLCDLAAGYRQLNVSPDQDGCLAHWVVEAPWAHPAWHSYSVLLISLRPMPDQRETLIYLDGATHELWVYAMNPNADRNKLLMNGIVDDHWLNPINFSAQFIEITDDLALDRVKASVQKICDGTLSPDTDFRQQWIELYGNNMQKDRPLRRDPVIRK